MKKLFWRIFALVAVIVWAALMADLALEKQGGLRQALISGSDENIYPTATTAGDGDESGLASESWYSIYLKKQKIGHSHNTYAKTDEGFRFTDTTTMRVKMLGAAQKVNTETIADLNAAYKLKKFSFIFTSDATSIDLVGIIDGKTLTLEINSGGSKSSQTISLNDEPHLAIELFSAISRRNIKAGDSFSLPVFDPGTLANDMMSVRVIGETNLKVARNEIPVYHIESTFKNMKSEAWIDRAGNMIKEISPLGFEILRVTEQQALAEGMRGSVSLDILDVAAVRIDKPIYDPLDTTFVRAILKNENINNFSFNDHRQKWEDGILTVTRENLADYSEQVTYPIAPTPELEQYLRPEPFIQSNSKEIIAAARGIVGDEKIAYRAAKKLLDWVFEELEKIPLASLPSASEILVIKKGDCNEHSTLLTALARSIGIPAKTEIGLVYLNGSFYYHAWVSLYVGQWITVDPSWGQFPADATHLRFVSGGLSKQVEIVGVMGSLEINVLETSR